MNDDPDTRHSWLARLSGLWQEALPEHEPLDALQKAIDEAQRKKSITPYTATMMASLLGISERQVRDIMVPRGQMVVLQEDWTLDQALAVILESGHSRYPVVDETHEKVLGILLSKDLLPHLCGERDAWTQLLRPVTVVPESKALDAMLSDFRAKRNHMALVIDEYGSLSGLVTIEDVIEEIVGEIDDEHDEVQAAQIVALPDGSYQVNALLPIEAFNAAFHCALSDEEAETIGGHVLARFGYMPTPGEEIELPQGWTMRINKANQRRIINLIVSPK